MSSCGSPIDINTNTCELSELDPLCYVDLWDCHKSTILHNTGTTLSITLPGRAGVTGGPLLNPLPFDHAHLHWGEEDDKGTEHSFDCHRFALEMQFVFAKAVTKLVPIKEAKKAEEDKCKRGLPEVKVVLDPESFDEDGKREGIDCTEAGPGQLEELMELEKKESIVRLKEVKKRQCAVASVLFEVTPDAQPYELFRYMKNVESPNTKIMVDGNLLAQFKCALKPYGYYTYVGRLTCPPYTQCTNWMVYDQIFPIRCEDVRALRTLLSAAGDPILGNAADLKTKCHRLVSYSVAYTGGSCHEVEPCVYPYSTDPGPCPGRICQDTCPGI